MIFSTNGEFRLPYRPPWPGTWENPPQCAPTPWNHARASDKNVQAYANVTQVHWPTGAPQSAVSPSAPTWRYDPQTQPGEDGIHCAPGVCGGWFVVGDLNGLSTQDVTPGVDDIIACASGQAGYDHNCFAAITNQTRDFRVCHKVGFKNLYAVKQWHGTFGIMGREGAYIYDGVTFDAVTGGFTLNRHWDPNNTYSGVKYRTVAVDYLNQVKRVTILPDGSEQNPWTEGFNVKGSSTIDRYTGVETRSGGGGSSYTDRPFVAPQGTILSGSVSNWMEYFAKFNTQPSPQGYFTQDSSGFKLWDWSDYANDFVVMESVNVTPGSGGRQKYHFDYDAAGNPNVYQLQYEESASWSDTGSAYSNGSVYYVPAGDGTRVKNTSLITLSVGYSDAYSANDCYQDALTALKAWDLSDDQVYPWRQDGYLAAAPMCCYDELPATAPAFIASPADFLINDYTKEAAVGGYPYYELTFATRPWLDERAYVWHFEGQYFGLGGTPPLVSVDDGNSNTYGTWPGGAELLPKQAAWRGQILTHNPEGYPSHFWFGFEGKVLIPPTQGGSWWITQIYHHGDWNTNYPLPLTTLRWQGPLDAQYSGLIGDTGTPPGHYRGNWVRNDGGKVEIGYYQEAKEIWKGHNFARPCGADKYAVDQTTVCYALAHTSDADLHFTALEVKKTGNAAEVNDAANGGLVAGNLVLLPNAVGVTGGVYRITAVADLGQQTNAAGDSYHRWRLTLVFVEDLPTGLNTGLLDDGFVTNENGPFGERFYVGRLRWFGAPGLQGAQAVSAYVTDPSSSPATLTFAAPQTFLRSGEAVDLLDANHNILAGNLTVTRVDDVSFTVLYGALSGVAYAIGHGLKFYWNDDMVVHRDYVQREWSFDLRTPNNPDPHFVQPPWYAGAAGCLGVTVSQPRAPFSSCYPAVITPPGLPGSFAGDGTYGALWLGDVAQTMTDPLWQMPFRMDGELGSPDFLTVSVDDGSGHGDTWFDGMGVFPNVFTKFVPYPPQVEAMAFRPGTHSVPGAGMNSDEVAPALPAGTYFPYDPAAVLQPPPDYPFGIADNGDPPTGDWINFPGIWQFYLNASRNLGRFAADYDRFVRKDPKI